MRRPLLLVGVACALVVLGLGVMARLSPYLPLDDSVERALQSTDWGALAATFPFFSWLGGPGGGPYMQVTAAVLVLLLNWRAWLFGAAVLAGGLWYPVLVNLVDRPRPTVDQVIRVSEHPGATSFPSGHVIYITLSLGIVMLCLGRRYLPRWAQLVCWVLVAAVVLTAGLSRLYAGVHWPTDVLAGILIATGWLALMTSIRWLSGLALRKQAAS